MKKTIILIFLGILSHTGFSQVFNTGNLTDQGKFSAGVAPAYFINGNSGTPLLLLYGNYALRNDIGLNLKIGSSLSKAYFGAAMTWGLGSNFTLGTGVHNFDYFGIDANLNYNIHLSKDSRLFTGLNASVLFESDTRLPLWVPLGVEVQIKDKLSFILETEIAVTKPAYHIISAGVAYYF
jgi:hypothetical protein